jgi:hypothetical protein
VLQQREGLGWAEAVRTQAGQIKELVNNPARLGGVGTRQRLRWADCSHREDRTRYCRHAAAAEPAFAACLRTYVLASIQDPGPENVHINAEMDSQSPFALLLVGQPTLARQLRLGVFAALDQRIATRYQLAPMDLAESAQYLRHHLALVGRTDPLVADDAIARLHKASLGLPRALNNAAIAALIAAATAGKALVDDDCAKKAVAELSRD